MKLFSSYVCATKFIIRNCQMSNFNHIHHSQYLIESLSHIPALQSRSISFFETNLDIHTKTMVKIC